MSKKSNCLMKMSPCSFKILVFILAFLISCLILAIFYLAIFLSLYKMTLATEVSTAHYLDITREIKVYCVENSEITITEFIKKWEDKNSNFTGKLFNSFLVRLFAFL